MAASYFMVVLRSRLAAPRSTSSSLVITPPLEDSIELNSAGLDGPVHGGHLQHPPVCGPCFEVLQKVGFRVGEALLGDAPGASFIDGMDGRNQHITHDAAWYQGTEGSGLETFGYFQD